MASVFLFILGFKAGFLRMKDSVSWATMGVIVAVRNDTATAVRENHDSSWLSPNCQNLHF
jgi:hypothetical protein